MHSVVSLLDERYARRILQVWEKLRSELGLGGVWSTPYPHFSYHVAGQYDRARVESRLARLASQVPSFRVRTGAPAVSQDDFPTVYLTLVPNAALERLHRQVWAEVDPEAHDAQVYYRPGSWVPHISLAHGDARTRAGLGPAEVRRALEVVEREDLSWEMPVRELALFWDDGVRQDLARSFPLR